MPQKMQRATWRTTPNEDRQSCVRTVVSVRGTRDDDTCDCQASRARRPLTALFRHR